MVVAVAAPPAGESPGRDRAADGAEPSAAPAPPRIPVAQARLLLDGTVDGRATAATLVELAARGVIRIRFVGDGPPTLELIDPELPTADHELILLADLFDPLEAGATMELEWRGRVYRGHTHLAAVVRRDARRRGLFTILPVRRPRRSLIIPALVLVGLAAVAVFFALPQWWLAFTPVAVGLVFVPRLIRRWLWYGRATTSGRRAREQVAAYRRRLAPARLATMSEGTVADYSAVLPWSMIFGVDHDWKITMIRQVNAGRIPDVAPNWYVSRDGRLITVDVFQITAKIENAIRTRGPAGRWPITLGKDWGPDPQPSSIPGGNTPI